MKKLTLLALLMMATAGCSMEASLESIIPESISDALKSPAKSTGLVSGSTQTGTTSGGGTVYHVQSTVGNYMSGIEQKTADGAYIVNSSVQGAIF